MDSVFCSVEDSVFVGFHPIAFVDLGNDTVVCDGEPITLTPVVNSIGSFLWNDGSTDESLEISIEGTYSVAILDGNNCPASDSVDVDVLTSLQPNLPNDTTICEDILLTLNGYQPSAETYLWQGESAFYEQNESTDTTFLITYPGIYSLETTNQCGGLTQYIEVTKEDCTCNPFIPNGFTPNQDGRNDEFQVYANCEILEFRMEIYDRWGSLLFATDNPLEGWDGISNGKAANSGVYVYRVEYSATDKNGNPSTSVKHGSVTLIK